MNDIDGSYDAPSKLENFSATGRPYKPPSKQEKGQYGMNSLSNAESFGAGPSNHLPVRYTDESLISVPVLRPEDIGKAQPQKTKKSLFSSRRKSENANFIVQQIPRGEYLKHYAKDDNGKYCGTEEPADDCILRGEDATKYRKGIGAFSNEIDRKIDRKSKDDGVIR